MAVGHVLGVPGLGGDDITFLLRDDFTTAAGAPLTSPRTAEPGPGTLTLTDTGNKLSISSGRLFIGHQANNDPRLADPIARARAAGLAAYFKFYTGTNIAHQLLLGWSTDADGLALTHRVYFANLGALALWNSAYSPDSVAANWSGAETYEIWHILRSTGHFVILDGVLVWASPTGAGTPLYAAISNFQAGNAARYIDTMRIAQLPTTDATLMPTPLISDSFTRANGAIGSTDGLVEPSATDTGGGDGLAYANATTWTIASNVAVNTPSVAADYLCYVDAGNANILHSVNVTRTAGEAGLVINAADTDNYIRMVHDGTNVITTEVVAGTPNVLNTTAKAYSAGAPMVAWRNPGSNTLRVYYNNAFVASVTPNVALQTNTLHGLYSDNAGNSLNDLISFATDALDFSAYTA